MKNNKKAKPKQAEYNQKLIDLIRKTSAKSNLDISANS